MSEDSVDIGPEDIFEPGTEGGKDIVEFDIQFRPGEVVGLVLDSKLRAQVIETDVQTCPGGTQINYVCRLAGGSFGMESVSSGYLRFNEIELKPLEETPVTLRRLIREARQLATDTSNFGVSAALRDIQKKMLQEEAAQDAPPESPGEWKDTCEEQPGE